MAIWTAETLNPYRLSQSIPMMLATTRGLVPKTVAVARVLNFQLVAFETRTARLDGRWMLQAWRALPEQPGIVCNTDLVSDGMTVQSRTGVQQNQYMVGPSASRTNPSSNLAIPQYIICETYIEMSGIITSGPATFDTEYVAVELEYS